MSSSAETKGTAVCAWRGGGGGGGYRAALSVSTTTDQVSHSSLPMIVDEHCEPEHRM
jgi:hypothetical protein